VQNLLELNTVNESDLSPFTTTLDELLWRLRLEEEVAFFRATFDGEGEARNIQSNINKSNMSSAIRGQFH